MSIWLLTLYINQCAANVKRLISLMNLRVSANLSFSLSPSRLNDAHFNLNFDFWPMNMTLRRHGLWRHDIPYANYTPITANYGGICEILFIKRARTHAHSHKRTVPNQTTECMEPPSPIPIWPWWSSFITHIKHFHDIVTFLTIAPLREILLLIKFSK